MKEICAQFAHYNAWANQRLVGVLASQPDELAEQALPGSFPSVRLTLLHIWDAEFIWLKRLEGAAPLAFPSKAFTGSMAEVYDGLLQVSGDFLAFVDAQEEGFFSQIMHFKTFAFGQQAQLARDMVLHCMNHSTFHRGQLVNFARQLGIESLPPTDLIYYLRELGSAGK